MNTTDNSLYEITGDIKDINTLLVGRAEIEALMRDAERYRALEWAQEADSLGPIFVARVRRKYPRSMFNVGLTIDTAMQEKQS